MTPNPNRPLHCPRSSTNDHTKISIVFFPSVPIFVEDPTMEPDVSIETGSMIRVAVLPVGSVPPTLLRDYLSMLLRHQLIPLSAISSFYTEHQKSPFSHQPWDSGSLRFKFILGGDPPNPWEDFQSNRKILAVIGICHCPSSPDLDSAIDQFNAACKSYTSALVERCFAFCPDDSQAGSYFSAVS